MAGRAGRIARTPRRAPAARPASRSVPPPGQSAAALPEPWIDKLPRRQRLLVLIGASLLAWLPLLLLGLALRRLLA